MFIPPESGKYYGLYECICAMVNRFGLCEIGTKFVYKQSLSCKSRNAYRQNSQICLRVR
jgi:hypothetical protein